MSQVKSGERELITLEQFASLSILDMEAILKMLQSRVGKALSLTWREQVGTTEYRERKSEYDSLTEHYSLLATTYHKAFENEYESGNGSNHGISNEG